jgi:hypothetical protein
MSLAFLGAFLGTYLGSTEYAERQAYYTEAEIDEGAYSWKTGLTWFFCQAVMALGLPFALAILPVKIYKIWSFKKEDALNCADFVQSRANLVPCVASGSHVTSFDGEMSIEIIHGRPDISKELIAGALVAKETAKTTGLPDQLGVYVAGPQALTRGVMKAVSEANSCCGGTAAKSTSFVLHKATAEL